ncbi:MAG: ABC transporter permease [Roseburia sp.]|nr:ABC transporter permease [Roseburia sp.]
MKKNDFTGWKEVFSFSFVQGVKQKSYVGFIIVMGLILLLYTPVATLIKQSRDIEEEPSEVTVLTVYDETGLPVNYENALPKERYARTLVTVKAAEGYEEHVAALETEEDSTQVVVRITYEEGSFHLTFVKSAKAALADKDYEQLAGSFEDFFERAKLDAVDVSVEQLAFVNRPVFSQIKFTSEEGQIDSREENESISLEEYYILFGGIVIVLMIISFSGSSIAVSVVTEKSTRVVEYLMMNVRPMALIVGKVLACLAMVVLQFAAMGACYFLSLVINGALFETAGDYRAVIQDSAQILSKMPGLQTGNVIIALAIILTGVLFFSMMAGLAGASVSKMEEMAEGLKIYQMVMITGYFIGIFLCVLQISGTASETMINICCILPVAAPFIVPGNLLLGKIGVGTALLSGALLMVLTVVLFLFTARVYEALIFYNGNVMKFKDILQIARTRRGDTGKGEDTNEKKLV